MNERTVIELPAFKGAVQIARIFASPRGGVTTRLRPDIRQWANEHLKGTLRMRPVVLRGANGDFEMVGGTLLFEYHEDAVLYSLRWADEINA